MNISHKEKILADFPKSDFELVVSILKSVELKHVMANSQCNLDNTWSAILYLSKGNFSDLESLVEMAKKDFRDVINGAIQEKK